VVIYFIFLIVHAQRTLTAAAASATCGFVIPSLSLSLLSHRYALPPKDPWTISRLRCSDRRIAFINRCAPTHARTHTLTHAYTHVHNIHIIYIYITLYILTHTCTYTSPSLHRYIISCVKPSAEPSDARWCVCPLFDNDNNYYTVRRTLPYIRA